MFRDTLSGLTGKIDLALVFGSMASGEQVASSDVDLLVLGDASLVEIVKAVSPLQGTLGREINPVAMAFSKFTSLLEKRDRFVVRVLDEPRIFVMGDESEFGKLVKDRIVS